MRFALRGEPWGNTRPIRDEATGSVIFIDDGVLCKECTGIWECYSLNTAEEFCILYRESPIVRAAVKKAREVARAMFLGGGGER